MSAAILITGLGVVTSIGAGTGRFADALLRGSCGIRLHPGPPPYAAAGLDDFDPLAFIGSLSNCPDGIRKAAKRLWLHSTRSARVTAAAAIEAWLDAGGDAAGDPERTGIVAGGNNISQQFQAEGAKRFAEFPEYLSPRHAFLSLDTHAMSQISELLGIRGFGLNAAAASASGNAALWTAQSLLCAGVAGRVLVCGLCQELSPLERQAYWNAGAMASPDSAADPVTLYRPFDQASPGFVAGEGAACLMLESAESAARRGATAWAELRGASVVLDASHLPSANAEGEVRSMTRAIQNAGLSPAEIDLVNAHGSGSPQGDAVECEALAGVFGDSKPWVNATKSLTGHCLTSAGLVEAAACAIQIRQGFVHPNRNLDRPIAGGIRFAGAQAIHMPVRVVLSNSFGFGGINSAVVLSHPDGPRGQRRS